MPLYKLKNLIPDLSREDKEKLICCFYFSKCLSNQEKYKIVDRSLISVNYLLNDFVIKRGPHKRGKTKDKIRKLKKEIKELKKNPISRDSKINEDWIKFKEEQLINIKPNEITRTENQELIEWLKEKTFDVYDRAHADYLINIKGSTKKNDVCYFINKSAFISIINYKLEKSFYGYSYEGIPVSWVIQNWPQSIQLNYKEMSSYKDARKHTLKIPSQAPFSPERQC